MSRILQTAAIVLATTAFASAASANCNGSNYCSSSNSYTANHGAYSSSMDYSSASSYSYAGVMSDAEASANYGSGSISNTYVGGDVQMHGFHGAATSVPGLGAGEYLQNTNCPTNVYNPDGGRVLGCYNVVKQVPQTNYVRVVRPIVYVRYPVPVAVPVYNYGCGMNYANTHHHGHWGHGMRRGGCR